MPGTFTYDEATNTVEVTAGTSGAPATFNDMYVADQAGTATDLLPAEAGAANNTLTYQIRPTHDKALIIKCVVAAKTAEADFIFITGTDAWGAAQTESLDVTAGNGTYTTTKRFATITNLDCSDNSAGGGTVWADGTIQVTQDIWGVVWEYAADSMYKIDCNVDFGDGSTATYFQSKNEFVYFDNGFEPIVRDNATLTLGELKADWGEMGSAWSMKSVNNSNLVQGGTAIWNFYGSFWQQRGTAHISQSIRDGATWNAKNSIISGTVAVGLTPSIWVRSSSGDVSIERLMMIGTNRLALDKTPTLMSNIHFHDCFYGVLVNADVVVEDALLTESRFVDAYSGAGVTAVFRNPRFHLISSEIQLIAADSVCIEQYTTNIHVTDKSGADLQSVDVDCEYAHLVEGTDSKTYKCIQDHTSVDATHKPITGSDWASFWELYDAGGGLGGVWQTTFDFKAGTQEFATATTDANGDIVEQVIQYKKWVGTSELLEARIHKFTFSHANYPDFIMEDKIISVPIVWEFDMGQSTSDLVTINETAIDNKINLTAGVVDRVTLADQVTLVDTTTTNSDMVGTAGANTVVPDAAGVAATLHGVTDGKIDVAAAQVSQIREWALGNWRPKSGVPGTYEVLDPADGVTPVMEVTPDGDTGILQVVIL